MGIHRSKEHCKDIAMTRYKKTPEVFNSGGFRIFRSLEMGLHSHYIRIFTTSNNTFLKTSLQTSLQNQTKQEGNEKVTSLRRGVKIIQWQKNQRLILEKN